MKLEKEKSRVTPEIVAGLRRIDEIDDEIKELKINVEYRQLKNPDYDSKELEAKIEELKKEKKYLLDKITSK